ncbi:hypothetical protein [Klebsiella pneumoniae]|uniref:hypothetical protein n=1 Tax=Klebsiella pneumoniae TaxID=573 RepID=UPI0020CD12A6|nr:hypothetical protein [Klebsiella pneumoniae]MCP5769809.1 hypothetical protein [Klebsiella pneumoniae]MCQ0976060.1 hypothetical protein [Klebsiella pneumoniae]MEA4532323.1 hypothetical protein [Klebsiella pneumoniae]
MKKCPQCEKLSRLDDHLYELSIACEYFTSRRYNNFSNISEWLKLSSFLDEVRIKPEKYAGSDLIWCRPAADAYEAERIHYSKYSTALTRFLYVSNALEETYRFVSTYYKPSSKEIKNKREFAESKKSVLLFEKIDDNNLPEGFHHYCENLFIKFDRYIQEYNPKISTIKDYPKNHKCHGLHIVRNLRNFIAHGTIPINLIPEYYGSAEMWHVLYSLLFSATRVTALYIQAFLLEFAEEFDFYNYLQRMDYDYYLERQEDMLNDNPSHITLKTPKNIQHLLTQLHFSDGFGYIKIANF